MDRIKSIALAALGIVIALAGLGLFASIGLAIIGTFFVMGACGAIAACATSFFAGRDAKTRSVA
ncbi:MAG: hypothetical protein AAF636_23750 [Pseudomonadota bacterium]